jgi:TonB family protein
MRTRYFLVLLLLLAGFAPGIARAQDQNNATDRKILKKTMPRYPEIARRMNLAGTVKVVALVTPDGKVKSMEPMGGNPVLIQAAEDAISQWRFATASGESKEIVELHFTP